MQMRNTATRWGLGSKLFHWTLAALILGSSIFVLHVNGTTPWYASSPMVFITYIHWHKSLGLIALVLIVGRILWRRANPVPRTAPLTEVQARTAHRVHIAIYVLMVAVPITGWIASSAFGSPTKFFGLFVIPGIIPKTKALVGPGWWAHFVLAWGLLAFVTLHIGAALWHHFKLKDRVLRAMWFGRDRTTDVA